MKKRMLCVVMVVLLMFAMASCSTQPDAPADSTAEQTDTVFDETTASAMENQPVPKPEHVTLLEGALSTDQYTLTADGEGCYVSFFEEYVATESELKACRTGEIHFDSLADMVESFQNDRFDDDERIIMQAAFPKSEKGIKVCDLNRLYDVTKPAETVVKQVSLSGQYYDFVIAQEGMFEFGWIVYTNEKAWNTNKDQSFVRFDSGTVTCDEKSTFDGVPCRIVEYYNTTETYRDIYIEVEENGKKTDIVLRYLLEDNRAYAERVSDTAPWQLLMFCEEDGLFYNVVIGYMLQTPTYEWLSSFGLTPYVPSASDNLATE